MKSDQISFEIALEDFDLTRLPVDQALLKSDKELLASTVRAYYEDCFRELGGSTAILVANGKVSVTWFGGDESPVKAVLDHAIRLLNQGEFSAAEPLLRGILARDERNGAALYNLGLMLSDSGRLDEAIEFAQLTKVPRVYLTHISHQMGLHDQVDAALPDGIHLAYDGLRLEV